MYVQKYEDLWIDVHNKQHRKYDIRIDRNVDTVRSSHYFVTLSLKTREDYRYNVRVEPMYSSPNFRRVHSRIQSGRRWPFIPK